MNFYFTYGSDPQYPFNGGWTLVVAENAKKAAAAFRAFHEDVAGVLNCALVYGQEEMEKSGMLAKGNRGRFCHECIVIASSLQAEDFAEQPSRAKIYALALQEFEAGRRRPVRCPRCGKTFTEGERGALSRRLPITICDACRSDEALEDYSADLKRTPLEEWDFVKYFKSIMQERRRT